MTSWRLAASLLLTTAAAALLGPPLSGQHPTFRASLDLVRVDALVTDGQKVVQGLRAEDFELRDNGVAQQVTLLSAGSVPLNVVLVLDASDSVRGARLLQLQDAGRTLLDGLSAVDQAGLVTFDESVRVRLPLTHDLAGVRDAIGAVTTGGGTALYDAVHIGIVAGNVAVGRSLAVLFSDGVDTSSYLPEAAAIDSARRGDVVVCAVTSGGTHPFVSSLAATTGGTVMNVDAPERLPASFARILSEFRQRYLLGYSPSGVVKGGWHRIDVRVKGRRLTVNARSGYQS